MINPFMSREQKSIRTKLAIRKGINDLNRYERSLTKAKNNMIDLGRKAKEEGSPDQVRLLVSGVRNIMTQQLRVGKMRIQLMLMENMHQLASVSSQFTGLIGKVSKEVTNITKNTNFMKNSAKMQEGMMNMELMMDQMDDFMTDFDSSLSPTQTEGISNSEIEQLFNLPDVVQNDAIATLEKQLQDEMNKQ